MFRKYVIPGLVGTALASVLALSAVTLHPQTVANAAAPRESASAPQQRPLQQLTIPNQYLWSYAAKFVCGYQSPFPTPGTALVGEPVVKPGNYATLISIHNPQYRSMKVFKKIVLLVDSRFPDQQRVVREPESVGMVVSDTIGLGPDYATLDDCNRIYKWLAPAAPLPAFPPPLISGYLVVLSRMELDVDATYTAVAPGAAQGAPTQPTGISIDEERVTGKRVPVPTSLFVP